ncbi:hypothetical protein ACFRCX_30500 [Streptomyces sp. NPDC056652]|uniref:hypothetical protein n=1 Tax=Streptomyces sp. NPDC056652 TaxID=3345893 RepID=UPI0036A3AFD7
MSEACPENGQIPPCTILALALAAGVSQLDPEQVEQLANMFGVLEGAGWLMLLLGIRPTDRNIP